MVKISIHAPREGGDLDTLYQLFYLRRISIHAPREGGDATPASSDRRACVFQSTPPARGATEAVSCAYETLVISIHAPREGGDAIDTGTIQAAQVISIHAPREGGDSKDAQFYLRIFDK